MPVQSMAILPTVLDPLGNTCTSTGFDPTSTSEMVKVKWEGRPTLERSEAGNPDNTGGSFTAVTVITCESVDESDETGVALMPLSCSVKVTVMDATESSEGRMEYPGVMALRNASIVPSTTTVGDPAATPVIQVKPVVLPRNLNLLPGAVTDRRNL